jgi:hypothetical protein
MLMLVRIIRIISNLNAKYFENLRKKVLYLSFIYSVYLLYRIIKLLKTSKKKPLIANACNGLIYVDNILISNCKNTMEILAIVA